MLKGKIYVDNYKLKLVEQNSQLEIIAFRD